MTISAPVALYALSDEELLTRCYMSKVLMTPMEQELASRLEHALDELRTTPSGISDILTSALGKTGDDDGPNA